MIDVKRFSFKLRYIQVKDIASFILTVREGRMWCSAEPTWNGENIKKRTCCNSPIKCWLSSDTSPLHPCDWLRLACGWERAWGSAGQTRRLLQTWADVAIILSFAALIQSKSKHMLRASRVWQMGHREQGRVSIMKPRGQEERGIRG